METKYKPNCINAIDKSGIYISMNGVIKDYTSVIKNKEKGYFE